MPKATPWLEYSEDAANALYSRSWYVYNFFYV